MNALNSSLFTSPTHCNNNIFKKRKKKKKIISACSSIPNFGDRDRDRDRDI